MSQLRRVLQKAFPFHAACWQVIISSIDTAVNEPDDTLRGKALKEWRTAMLSQLANVSIVGAITSALIVGSFTWPALDQLSSTASLLIHLAWLCSLVLGIGAAAVAMHQSIFLMRIDVLRDANDMCQHLLTHGVKSNGRRDVRLEQGIIWQAAVGMLEWSIYTWMAGFLIFIGDLTRAESKHVVGNSPVVAACCFLAFAVTLAIYIGSILRLWFMAGTFVQKPAAAQVVAPATQQHMVRG